jgi:hypothetical protein
MDVEVRKTWEDKAALRLLERSVLTKMGGDTLSPLNAGTLKLETDKNCMEIWGMGKAYPKSLGKIQGPLAVYGNIWNLWKKPTVFSSLVGGQKADTKHECLEKRETGRIYFKKSGKCKSVVVYGTFWEKWKNVTFFTGKAGVRPGQKEQRWSSRGRLQSRRQTAGAPRPPLRTKTKRAPRPLLRPKTKRAPLNEDYFLLRNVKTFAFVWSRKILETKGSISKYAHGRCLCLAGYYENGKLCCEPQIKYLNGTLCCELQIKYLYGPSQVCPSLAMGWSNRRIGTVKVVLTRSSRMTWENSMAKKQQCRKHIDSIAGEIVRVIGVNYVRKWLNCQHGTEIMEGAGKSRPRVIKKWVRFGPGTKSLVLGTKLPKAARQWKGRGVVRPCVHDLEHSFWKPRKLGGKVRS